MGVVSSCRRCAASAYFLPSRQLGLAVCTHDGSLRRRLRHLGDAFDVFVFDRGDARSCVVQRDACVSLAARLRPRRTHALHAQRSLSEKQGHPSHVKRFDSTSRLLASHCRSRMHRGIVCTRCLLERKVFSARRALTLFNRPLRLRSRLTSTAFPHRRSGVVEFAGPLGAGETGSGKSRVSLDVPTARALARDLGAAILREPSSATIPFRQRWTNT